MSGDWRPRAGLATARLRAAMSAHARDFFAQRNVLEIDAPAISQAAVSDPNVDSIGLRMLLDRPTPRYLHTSPEYAMKRLLAAGFPDIYFLGRVFRDGEAGRRHQPEFTMVEWYRLGFDLVRIMDETEAFLAGLLDGPAAARRLTYRRAFELALAVDPVTAPLAELTELAGADPGLRDALADDRDAWLDLLMSTRVATGFPGDRLTTVHGYPASQAALARLSPEDATVADRFEVFLGDLELANGYVELRDGVEQRRRFDADQRARRLAGRPIRPVDDDFLACLDAGLPACAGVAVGFDRLVMINAGCDDIRDVLHFPFEPRDA